MSDTPHPLYCIDGYGLIFRSYFAFMSQPLRNTRGQNISALFGFARTLVSLLNQGAPVISPTGLSLQPPLRMAVAFDSRTPTFRHERYSEYKATRQKAPQDLHDQVPMIEETLLALGIPALQCNGFEADDIIATLARICQKEGRPCYIISSDKDLLQLVNAQTWALRPERAARGERPQRDAESPGIGYDIIGEREVREEWGVNPEGMLDLLSLTGDSSDNVPGVRGIGEKTAVKLMAKYGSLDAIYANLAGIEGAVGKKLAQGRENAYFSKELIALRGDVPIGIETIEELSIERIDRRSGAAVLSREGIFQSARALLAGAAPAVSGPEVVPTVLEVSGTEVVPDTGEYSIVRTVSELAELLESAQRQGLLALDFETDSLDAWNARPIGISLALESGKAVYAPLAPHLGGLAPGDTGGSSPFLEGEAAKALLAPLFDNPKMTILAHNAKFDYQVSRGWGIRPWKCRIWDTMVAAWVLDPDRNAYSLDSLATSYLEYTMVTYDSVVPKGSAFDSLDLETAARYSAEDADCTFRLMEYLTPRLEAVEALDLFCSLEMPLLPILAEMEGQGIRIERGLLLDYGVELSALMLQVQEQTYTLVGHDFNLGSTKQLQEVLFQERKLKPGKRTKTGYSTDVAVLEELALEDPVPALILRYRTLAKLKSTYVDALVEEADSLGRLHTNYVQTGTATGRLSSKEPNLQNIPIREEEGRKIREAFVAESGQVLISADYSQIELVVLAHLSQDATLLAAFTQGKDIHARTASLIFGTPEEEVSPGERRIAKTINFGVMYGMSAFRLARELGISRAEATSFIDSYFKTYAGVSHFMEDLIRKTEETGYVTTILGRRRYIRAINSRNKTEKAAAQRVAVNTPIQGSAADIVKTAMIKLTAALQESGSKARLLLQVHDELILECPEEEAKAASDIIRREMENAVPLSIPLKVSIEIGKRWGDFH